MFDLQIYEYFDDLNLGLVKYKPKNKHVLDVACGQGLLGEVYRKNGNIVEGIDLALEVNKVAKKRLNKFYNEDITDYKKIKKILGRRKFDVIIFADILEHIFDPIGVITFYKKYLHSEGQIFISVPNFVVWYTRFHILFGNYTYTDTGTRDKTHIRLFTPNNIKKMAQVTNMQILVLDITPGIARFFLLKFKNYFTRKDEIFDRGAIIKSKYYKYYVKYIYRLEYLFCRLLPGLFAFQYIVVLELKNERNKK